MTDIGENTCNFGDLGWAWGSVDKTLASQTWGHGFDPQSPCKNARLGGAHLYSHCWGHGESRILGTHWQASII